MAKAIEFVVDLTVEEAKKFLSDIGKPNSARDATIKRAKNLRFDLVR